VQCSFEVELADHEECKEYTVKMYDSWGDGWDEDGVLHIGHEIILGARYMTFVSRT